MRIVVVILTKFEGQKVITIWHDEMISRISPALGLVKGLLIVHSIGNGAGIGGGGPRVSGVVTPASRRELLIGQPSQTGAVHELGPARVDANGHGVIGREGRGGRGSHINGVV